MHKVKNGKIVHEIAVKSLTANRLRNVVAIIAIVLTTLLFTTVFTVGLSINEAIQQANFRMTGGYAHATLKYLTEEQFNEFKSDSIIKEYGLRRLVGMPKDFPFNKSHVEVGYSDENNRKWMYLKPIEGDFPKEGTNEAATDIKVLSLLGVEPVIGAQFTMSFYVDGTETTETFTLSGFWNYDEAIVANHVIIPMSRAENIFTKLGTTGKDGMTSTWNLDIMFKNSLNIEKNLQKLITKYGYQDQSKSEPSYVATGVNWGYTSSQFADNFDPMTLVAILILMLIIIFTGYLIIYNVFQISVARDIRFYGLLKTIGTTPRQLGKIIRKQAFILSTIGIPLGLFLGYFVGVMLTPVILSRLNGVVIDKTSVSPFIFIGSALFALFTVFLSCAKPGRVAANVSPIDAVRYAEGAKVRKIKRKNTKGVSLPKMALANLGRSRGKTAITVISLSLAILMLNLTVTFTNGFDMDKYLRRIVVDFIVSEASYFQVTRSWGGTALEEDAIELLKSQGDIVDGGRVYGRVTPALEFVSEDYFKGMYSAHNPPEIVERLIERSDRLPNGKIATHVQLYGMEDFILGKLTTLEGDIEKLKDPSGRYIAAVYMNDDYENPYYNSNWAKLGDLVTVRYVEEMEYRNPKTGEVYDGLIPDNAEFKEHITKYHDVEYEVAAMVTIPHSLSYRYFGTDEFILNADAFMKDTGTNITMYYAFDTTAESNPKMEEFLSEYTQNEGSMYDYESKESYKAEFYSFRNMFLILGSVLSSIIGLVGILNFLNAVLTSIITRRKEFAMLQSIGMTGSQLKSMLVWESLYYTIGSVAICMILSFVTAPLMDYALGSAFWFFSHRFTFLPILGCVPFMLLISFIVPSSGYRGLVKQSVVERLREVD